jgi:hypothetical protein
METAVGSRSGSVRQSCSSARRVMKRREVIRHRRIRRHAATKRRGALVAAEAERAAHRVLVVAAEADTVAAVEAEAVTLVVAADTEVTARFSPR